MALGNPKRDKSGKARKYTFRWRHLLANIGQIGRTATSSRTSIGLNILLLAGKHKDWKPEKRPLDYIVPFSFVDDPDVCMESSRA